MTKVLRKILQKPLGVQKVKTYKLKMYNVSFVLSNYYC